MLDAGRAVRAATSAVAVVYPFFGLQLRALLGDFGFNLKVLVIGIDAPHRLHPRIIGAPVLLYRPLITQGLLIPIANASNKRRNQSGPSIRTGNCLHHRKKQGHIAMNAFLLELTGCHNTFPSAGKFD
jgi:hypothetical protein